MCFRFRPNSHFAPKRRRAERKSIVSVGSIYLGIMQADRDGLEKFGDEYRSYMQRVPRANFLLGVFHLVKAQVKYR